MGSSYDIGLDPQAEGIIPRVVRNIFEIIEQQDLIDGRRRTKVSVQFLEVYGEDIIDLLDVSKSSRVAIHENPQGEVYVTGATQTEVSSSEQMMRQLEKGTKQRTTASTKMNQSSSRSHAIFTVFLEQLIFSDIAEQSDDKSHAGYEPEPEIRRCKFAFVDLAGSERASRTGTEGKQFKEGIDINKGLFALGNVISALGDETKRGQHVPYRSSKLTRMLQDSLGGNSRTLMICCVSPAESNFYESLNALRYANRARNIRNKPVINRDPTNALIASLRDQVKVLACEILCSRSLVPATVPDFLDDEQAIAAIVEEYSSKYLADSQAIESKSQINSLVVPKLALSRGPAEIPGKQESMQDFGGALRPKPSLLAASHGDLLKLKNENTEVSLELEHQKALVKQLEARLADSESKNVRTIAERDFFRSKLAESCPDEFKRIFDASDGAETESSVNMMETYVKEIESLKSQLLAATLKSTISTDEFDEEEAFLEANLTNSVARIIQQTKASLFEEQEKVRNILAAESIPVDASAEEEPEVDEVNQVEDDVEQQESQERRQKILTAEVIELSQSIKLKEELLEQLVRSQQQYAAMKKFYEERLEELNRDLDAKESEREKLLAEIETLAKKPVVSKDREMELRGELKRRDQELVELRKSKTELSHLSNVQARVNEQMSRLQSEIKEMKSQRIELSKTLQTEKKNHLQELNLKMREIERLKRELSKSSNEIKKMSALNERNEAKLKKVLNDSITLRKKNTELQKTTVNRQPPTLSSVRQSARYVMATAARTIGNVFSSSSEAKTRSWLDSRISKISSRELELNDIQRQCQQQLVSADRKESLELKKSMLHEAIGTDNAQMLPAEEANVLIDVEERIDGPDTELRLRGESIASVERKLAQRTYMGKEETFDALRRTAANTLPGAQLLIKLLFDMMVESHKKIIELQETKDSALKQVKELQKENEEAAVRYRSLQRSHDIELSKAMKDYEEKLSGLFNYSNAGRLINLETVPEDKDDLAPRAIISSPRSRESVNLTRRMSVENLKSSVNASIQSLEVLHLNKQASSTGAITDESELMGQLINVKTLLKVSSEQVKSLKHQIDIDSYQQSVLKGQLEEAILTKEQLQQELSDKSFLIKFLEDELKMFREKVEEYKLQLPPLPAPTSHAHDQREENQDGDKADDEDALDIDEEEEFQKLAEEIHRTGLSKGYGSREIGKAPVYERLSDPSHYTGSIREVFKEDVVEKRRLVAQVKESKSKEAKPQTVAKLPSSEPDNAQDGVFTRLTGRARTAAEKLREIRSNPEAPITDAWARSNYASLEDRSLVKPRLSAPKPTIRAALVSPSKSTSEEVAQKQVRDKPDLFIETAEGVTLEFKSPHSNAGEDSSISRSSSPRGRDCFSDSPGSPRKSRP